jgi:hypothetical protein
MTDMAELKEMDYSKITRGDQERKLKQEKREVQCAVKLAKLLDNYIQDSTAEKTGFTTMIEAEAKDLASTSFGSALIGVLAYVYAEQASRYLGFKESFASGMGVNSFAQSAHIFSNKVKILGSALKVLQVTRKDQLKTAEGGKPEISKESVGGIMETLWNYTVVDVEFTLRNVCLKVLKDCSVSHENRVERAEALLLVGHKFQEFAQTAEAGLNEFGNQFASSLAQETQNVQE